VKNVESLWLVLSHVQAKHMERLLQDPFDGVDSKYREPLGEQVEACLRPFLLGVNLDVFMPNLYECILFRLTVDHQMSDDPDSPPTDMTSYPLGYTLHEYLEGKQTTASTSSVATNVAASSMPGDVKVKHCVATWRLAYALSLQQNKQP